MRQLPRQLMRSAHQTQCGAWRPRARLFVVNGLGQCPSLFRSPSAAQQHLVGPSAGALTLAFVAEPMSSSQINQITQLHLLQWVQCGAGTKLPLEMFIRFDCCTSRVGVVNISRQNGPRALHSAQSTPIITGCAIGPLAAVERG